MLTKKDIEIIDKLLGKRFDEELSPIKSDIKTIKSDIVKIRKDVSSITDFFDSEYLELRKRVERIETHLNLTPIQ